MFEQLNKICFSGLHYYQIKEIVKQNDFQALENYLSKLDPVVYDVADIINKTNSRDENLLTKAQSVKVAEILIKYGIKVDKLTTQIQPPGHYVQRGILSYHMDSPKMLKYLITHGARIYRNSERLSSCDEITPTVEDFVIERYVDVLRHWLEQTNQGNPLVDIHEHSASVLNLAVQREQIHIIEMLIDHTENNPNLKRPGVEHNALHYAFEHGEQKLIPLMINKVKRLDTVLAFREEIKNHSTYIFKHEDWCELLKKKEQEIMAQSNIETKQEKFKV